MFNYPYLVELLTPRKSIDSRVEDHLDRFAERYRRVIDIGCGITIPDNPMGKPRFGALESIGLKNLSMDTEKLVMNLNTFHTKSELDGLLEKAAKAGLKYILVIRGDGGPLLPKLDPKSIGGKFSVATTIDLIRYINKEYPNRFITGAAFNPYKKMPLELDRLKQKIEAGARYVVTQPILGRDENVDSLTDLDVTIVVEAWMSNNIDLLYKSVGREKNEEAKTFNPIESLKALHEYYPECCVYLSMLSFEQDWQDILPRLSK